MPVSLLSFHTIGPRTADGEPRLVLRRQRRSTSRLPLAERYQQAIEHQDVQLDADHQRKLVDIVMDCQQRHDYRCFAVAADENQVLALVAWDDERAAVDIRAAIKASLSRGMNQEFGRQTWLGDGGGHKRVRNRTQFDYLSETYLPQRAALVWTCRRGFVAPAGLSKHGRTPRDGRLAVR